MTHEGRKCVFCGTRPAENKEHALPCWIQRCLDPEGKAVFHHSYTNAAGETERSWTAKHFDFQVKRTCAKHCNEGWMSVLESAAQPFLGSLVKGCERTLHRDGQQIISFWAVKTAIVWELVVRNRVLPDRWFAEIYDGRTDRRLPRGVQVWIGACNDPRWSFLQCGKVRLACEKSGAVSNGYGVTFTAGHLLMQIFGHDFGDDRSVRSIVEGTRLERTMLPIWPYKRKVEMPPPLVVTPLQVEQLAKVFMGAA
jgi:hypothetical protein